MRAAFVVARYSDTSTTCDTESALMLKLLIAYTTYDGHTAKIAARIASALRDNDCAVEVCVMVRSPPTLLLVKEVRVP